MILTREQVETLLTSLVNDKVDSAKVEQLLDHDAAQWERLEEVEQALARITQIIDGLVDVGIITEADVQWATEKLKGKV